MRRYNEHINVASETFPLERIDQILKTPGIFFDNCHVLYPADENGAHLTRFLSIESVAADWLNGEYPSLSLWIVEDMFRWIRRERIDFDVVFAPDQPGIRDIVKALGLVLQCRMAFWEYHDTGRFGDVLVSGEVRPGDRVLVFNGVTQTGRCVGERLQEFVEQLGGQVVAIAVFAKGTSAGVKTAEEKYGPKFYSAIQVDIPVYNPEECPRCKTGDKDSLRPWTELLKNIKT